MSNKKFHLNAKGYYIALVLCAAAIGVSGYLYYRSAQTADTPAAATGPVREQIPASSGEAAPPTLPVTEPTEPEGKIGKTVSPVTGEVVAEYAMDCLSYNETTRDWRVHAGMDLAAEPGTEVVAAADGEVYTVYEDDTMGMTVVIRHNEGYTTTYASLGDEVFVKAGDKVSAGERIGTVGRTALMESALADHVCFRVSRDGEPVDPAAFLELN